MKIHNTVKKTLISLLFTPHLLWAAGLSEIPDDSNSRIGVGHALAENNSTRLVYYTRPNLGDPLSGQECVTHVYAATLHSRLTGVKFDRVASEVCGNYGVSTRAMPGGDVLVLTHRSLQRWQGGRKLQEYAIPMTASGNENSRDTAMAGMLDIGPDGHGVVVLPMGRPLATKHPSAGYVVVGIDIDEGTTWKYVLSEPGRRLNLLQLWAGAQGATLIHLQSSVADGSSMSVDNMLVLIDDLGNAQPPVMIKQDKSMNLKDLESLGQQNAGDLSKLQEMMSGNYLETLTKIAASPRPEGGFDVLLARSSKGKGRDGHFLYRLGADGSLETEYALTPVLDAHGLAGWKNFYVTGHKLVLQTQVSASHGISGVSRKKVQRTAVASLNLENERVDVLMMPLDRRYLMAYLEAGDEQLQTLENWPAGHAAALDTLGGFPLSVDISKLNGRSALVIAEVNDQLQAFTEVADQQQRADQQRAEKQQQRTTLNAQQEKIHDDMAAALGISRAEYDAMSNRERQEAMLRSGDMAAMMGIVAEQVRMAQQQMAGQSGGAGQSSQAQQDMANAMKAMGIAQPAPASSSLSEESEQSIELVSEETVELDGNLRGFIKFVSEGADSLNLVIKERPSQKQIYSKEFAGDTIFELMDFGRFDLPVERLHVEVQDQNNNTVGILILEPPD